MYCKKCGTKLEDSFKYCNQCGSKIDDTSNYNNYSNQSNEIDEKSIGLNILSFFIPLIGFVLFCCYISNCPKKAKSCLKWSAISIILYILANFIFVILLIFSSFNNNLKYTEDEYIDDYDYQYYYEEEINEFSSKIKEYYTLAINEYKKNITSNNLIETPCYDIQDLYDDTTYSGTIYIIDDGKDAIISITNQTYYIDNIKFSDFSTNMIKEGSNISNLCISNNSI